MTKAAFAALSLLPALAVLDVLACQATTPARAAPMTASCARLLDIGSGEAGFIYYEAEADLGTDTANRLWAAYHRLRRQCVDRPWASVTVNVEPRVKIFLDAHR
jgi:hypothetical protein